MHQCFVWRTKYSQHFFSMLFKSKYLQLSLHMFWHLIPFSLSFVNLHNGVISTLSQKFDRNRLNISCISCCSSWSPLLCLVTFNIFLPSIVRWTLRRIFRLEHLDWPFCRRQVVSFTSGMYDCIVPDGRRSVQSDSHKYTLKKITSPFLIFCQKSFMRRHFLR